MVFILTKTTCMIEINSLLSFVADKIHQSCIHLKMGESNHWICCDVSLPYLGSQFALDTFGSPPGFLIVNLICITKI